MIKNLRIIQKKGSRLTSQRRKILETLTHYPQSVREIKTSLKRKGINTDKTTIYRNLDFLTGLNIVDRTQFKGKGARYELVDGDNHHHHLVCDNCNEVSDISMDEKSLLKNVAQKTKFAVKSHSLEFYGLCVNCQTKDA